jgi:hypothetical protein
MEPILILILDRSTIDINDRRACYSLQRTTLFSNCPVLAIERERAVKRVLAKTRNVWFQVWLQTLQ